MCKLNVNISICSEGNCPYWIILIFIITLLHCKRYQKDIQTLKVEKQTETAWLKKEKGAAEG